MTRDRTVAPMMLKRSRIALPPVPLVAGYTGRASVCSADGLRGGVAVPGSGIAGRRDGEGARRGVPRRIAHLRRGECRGRVRSPRALLGWSSGRAREDGERAAGDP